VQPRTAKARIIFPVEKGDLCLIVFADRNIENWQSSDGSEVREVRDIRRHALSDAFAILGGFPSLNPARPKVLGALNIEVEPETKVTITNGNVELLQLFDDIMVELDSVLDNIQNATYGGDSLDVATPFVTNQANIDTIKAKLGQLKA
jgi:hypothetical protein